MSATQIAPIKSRSTPRIIAMIVAGIIGSYFLSTMHLSWNVLYAIIIMTAGVTVIIWLVALLAGARRSNATLEMQVEDQARELDSIRTESKLRRKFAIEGSGDGLWDWNLENNIVYFSGRWKEMLGYAESDIGNSFSEWESRVHPDDKTQVVASFLAFVSGETSDYMTEHRIKKKDGTWLWVLAQIMVVRRNTSGAPLHLIGTNTDISDRVQMNNDLQQALESSKAHNVTMNRLMRTVAHEFRTPLCLLTGSVDILDRYWDRLTFEQRFTQTEHIRSATNQMSNLINSMISFNQMGTNRSLGGRLLLDIEMMCRTIAAEVAAASANGLECTVTISGDCGSALLDEIQFRRILENLLTNAFRYTPANGAVSLHVTREKNRLSLVISDTGIGIPEEDQSLIFDSFYRSQNVEDRRGLGLGLSIVRDAVLKMAATITFISKIGEGTTMRVEIPVDVPA